MGGITSLNQDRIHEFPSPMLNIIIHIDFLQFIYILYTLLLTYLLENVDFMFSLLHVYLL
jgi:hypothetical protein